MGDKLGKGMHEIMMILTRWEELPDFMRTEAVRPYYDILARHKCSIVLKRLFDVVLSFILTVLLIIPMLIIAVMIRLDSKGSAFYRQERVTTNGKHFKIHKFRTMVVNADKIGSAVTVSADRRVTNVGRFLRRYRFDELPQVIDVLRGDMSFVGTRPEVPKYVEQYTPEMMATLLLPAGVTSEASIRYKDEYKLLGEADDVDKMYMEKVLPAKMVWNLESVRRFRFLREILTMFRTVAAVCGKRF